MPRGVFTHVALDVKEVDMDAVPVPDPLRKGKYLLLYAKLTTLAPGKALAVSGTREQHAADARSQLRALARKDNRTLSSSHTPDRMTRYFWLEPLGETEPGTATAKAGRK